MKKMKLLASALAAMLAVPTLAQSDNLTVDIRGNLIDWYYYGKDIHSSATGWFQQSAGGGAWIDDQGVAHPAGAANYGLLSLTLDPGASKPLLPEFLIRNTTFYGNCSGVYVGGNTYYSFFGHEADYESNMDSEYGSESYEILARKWTWDDDFKNAKCETVGKLQYQPTDLTYDPIYDKVYGVFYFSSGSEAGYKVGELNMTDFSVRFISKEAMSLTGELRCLAINSKGELYGIDASGNVYKVSKEDGSLTTIGNVGFKSQRRMMSATFDFRTDKLYWLGYMNNGKSTNATDGTNTTLSVADGGRDTGIYEVDTNTGKATLIGKTDFVDVEMEYDDNGQIVGAKTNQYGKMQLTGIYVEGAFTKHDVDQCITLGSYTDQLKAGGQATVSVNVKNIGTQVVMAKNYSVKLYVNDEVVATIDRDSEPVFTDNLQPGTSQTYTFSYTAPAEAGHVSIYAEVVNTDDKELRNNKTDVAQVIILSEKTLPGVQLAGVVNGNSIDLSWENPNGRMVEGAENFAAFSYDNLTPWCTYDGDKGYTQRPSSYNASMNYPNWNTPKAFIVFNAKEAGADLTVGGEKFYPHSGQQSFAAWFTAVVDNSEAGGHLVPNDDWLISPELSAKAQTIEFWGKGYRGIEATGYATEMNPLELMRVLYTTKEYTAATEWNADDWQVARDTFEIDNSTWTRYKAQLPDGAKHFALQCVSQDGFVTMIDDIAFDVNVGAVTGYNVYKNGQLVTTLAANATSYKVARTDAASLYTVTAVYAEGESYPSNAIGIDLLTSIDEPAVATTAVKGTQVFDIKGQQVKTMTRPGLYIIKQNGKTRKVVK